MTENISTRYCARVKTRFQYLPRAALNESYKTDHYQQASCSFRIIKQTHEGNSSILDGLRERNRQTQFNWKLLIKHLKAQNGGMIASSPWLPSLTLLQFRRFICRVTKLCPIALTVVGDFHTNTSQSDRGRSAAKYGKDTISLIKRALASPSPLSLEDHSSRQPRECAQEN